MNKVKNVNYGASARQKLQAGVNKLGNAVKATMGPSGRTVILEREYGTPVITKDGVSVAKEVNLKDPVENLGAQVVKEVAMKTAKIAGDGTTTATVLAQTILNEGLKHADAGANVIEIKRGMDKATAKVVEYLKQLSNDVVGSDQIRMVATTSANNDALIGSIIANAMDSVGKKGVITVDESKTSETTLEIVEGLQFDRGYVSPYFVTDNTTMTATLENPYILIYDKRISSIKEVLPLLETCSKQNKPLLIIAEDIDGEALATMVLNKARGILNICAVKAPGFGDRRGQILEDIATLTGGTVISPQKGTKLDKLTTAMLGTARRVVISKDESVIVDGAGAPEDIETRVSNLSAQLATCESDHDMLALQERIARLIGGVAVINVGASSEVEMKEKKDRVDDALNATKAAVEEGILPGGGLALLSAAKVLRTMEVDNEDQKIGVSIVEKACTAPFDCIMSNAGLNPEVIKMRLESVEKENPSAEIFGWDARTNKICSVFDAGIIDPTKVTRTALEMAVSVAGMLLTTEAVVSIEPDTDKDAAESVMPGMY
jgi:chaperonin GroEL